MKLSRIIGVLLIALSLFVGYMGINKISESTVKVEVLDIELQASDESGKQTGYVYLGFGVLLLISGIYAMRK